MQIKAGQGATFIVQLQRRDFLHVPPVLGESKVVLALTSAQVLGCAVQDVFAKWLRDTDAFVCVFATETVKDQVNTLGTYPIMERKKPK